MADDSLGGPTVDYQTWQAQRLTWERYCLQVSAYLDYERPGRPVLWSRHPHPCDGCGAMVRGLPADCPSRYVLCASCVSAKDCVRGMQALLDERYPPANPRREFASMREALVKLEARSGQRWSR